MSPYDQRGLEALEELSRRTNYMGLEVLMLTVTKWVRHLCSTRTALAVELLATRDAVTRLQDEVDDAHAEVAELTAEIVGLT